MVNFNFGLGADDSATPADPAGTQNTSTTDDSAAPVVAEPAPSVEKAKPLAELMTEEGSSTEKIDVLAPVEIKKEVVAKEPEIDIPSTETPVNKVPEISTPDKTPEVKDEKTEEKPAVAAPANPFSVPTVTPEAKEEKNEEPKKENTPAPVAPSANPFSVPTVTPEVKKEEKKEEPQKENTPAPVVPAASPFSVPAVTPEVKNEEKKEEIKKEIEIKPNKPSTPEVAPSSSNSTNATNDPMQAVGQVKSDIVAFVDFHKKNIKQFQTEISGLETKIQEEKKLLKNKGDAYATMLKELQDLTQNFGLNENGHTKQPHRPQNSNHPQSSHKK